MLLDLIRQYAEYCRIGPSAGDLEDYLLGWLSEEEVRIVLTELQRITLKSGHILERVILKDQN